MSPAARSLALLAPLFLAAWALAQPAAPRVAPTRPGAAPASGALNANARATIPARSVKLAAVPVTKIRDVQYVPMREAAVLIGFKATWLEKERQLVLTDGSTRVEFDAGSREVSVNGLRLFLGNPVLLRNGLIYVTRIDFERMLAARLRPALLPSPLPRPKVIAIDPGHGGGDNGMENKKLGLKEKVLTLDVAQRLQKLLVAQGYKVVLTRTEDRVFSADRPTELRKRSELANRAGADLFVSIHFNSLYPDTKTSGTETYVFTPQLLRSDRSQSPLEPDDTERTPSTVNRYDPWSALLSQMMHREVIEALKSLDRGQKTMHALVLRDLDCPAVLVESAFLSNDEEAKLSSSPAGRQRIAAAIASGIAAYADALGELQPKAP